jgi:hypothetical protein
LEEHQQVAARRQLWVKATLLDVLEAEQVDQAERIVVARICVSPLMSLVCCAAAMIGRPAAATRAAEVFPKNDRRLTARCFSYCLGPSYCSSLCSDSLQWAPLWVAHLVFTDLYPPQPCRISIAPSADARYRKYNTLKCLSCSVRQFGRRDSTHLQSATVVLACCRYIALPGAKGTPLAISKNSNDGVVSAIYFDRGKGGPRRFHLPCRAFDPGVRPLTDLGLETHE